MEEITIISKNVAFTGHRNIDRNRLQMVVDCVKIQVLEDAMFNGYTQFYTGMARGFDMIAAEAVIEIKEIFKILNIKLTAVIPFRGQSSRYSPADKERYAAILAKCDKIIYLNEEYSKGCYFQRNDYMVNHSGKIIAYYDCGGFGGTAYTVAKAKKMNRDIVNIYDEM